MSREPHNYFPLAKNLTIIAVVSVSAAAAALGVLFALDHTAQLPAMLIAAGVCTAGALLALVPLGMASGGQSKPLLGAAMIGMALRMIVSLGGAAALGAATGYGAKPVLAWTIGWYLLLLVLEVTMISRFMSRLADEQPVEGGAAC